MRINYYDPIVKVLQKRIGKVIYDSDLQSLQREILGSDYDIKKFYKLIFQLKQKKHLISLRKDCYLISYPENTIDSEHHIIEQFYRDFLYQELHKNCKKNYYIWWIQWLELHLNDTDYKEYIEVYNMNLHEERPLIKNCSILFKSYNNKDNQKKSHPCFQLWLEHSKSIVIEWKVFSVWSIELCILESLYYHNGTSYPNELIKKILKKFGNKRDRSFVKKILLSGRHHSSINRLYEIGKKIDPIFANQCMDIIKQFWFKINL